MYIAHSVGVMYTVVRRLCIIWNIRKISDKSDRDFCVYIVSETVKSGGDMFLYACARGFVFFMIILSVRLVEMAPSDTLGSKLIRGKYTK